MFKQELNKQRFAELQTLINATYSIQDFLADKGIKVESNVQICCPLHDDSTPSFSVDVERNVWKCFGCPDGGGFLALYKRYVEKYQNDKSSVYSLADHLLSKDTVLQGKLGYKSIFNTFEEEYSLFDAKTSVFEDKLLTPKPPIKVSTIGMYHVIQKLCTNPDIIPDFIYDCQCGKSEIYLINKYYYNKDIDAIVKSISSNDIDDFTSQFEAALEES